MTRMLLLPLLKHQQEDIKVKRWQRHFGLKREDLVRNTAIGGNVDTDKFIQFIKIAQEIHIQNYTGTKLYDKISNDIIAGTLANPYLALVSDYLQPMVIHWANVEYLPFAAYTIGNGGVFKHNSENSTTADKVGG
jgi:hypothetical protein